MILFLAILCSNALSFRVFSQNIRTISTENGLPQSFISGIVQDGNGFVWIGTRNGLARYDGRQLKIFQNKFSDTTSLVSNIINGIKKDPKGQLWIEYESGQIDIFNPKTEKVQHFITNDILKSNAVKFKRDGWIISSAGIFWSISENSGINCFKNPNKISHFSQNPNGLQSGIIRGILEDNKHHIWALTQKGLSRFDPKIKAFKAILSGLDINFSKPDLQNNIIALHQRKNGELMWGDQQNLYFFNTLTSQLKKFPLPVAAPKGIKWIASHPDGIDYFEANGYICSYNEKAGIKIISDVGANAPWRTTSFLIDQSGLIWLGTNRNGIYQIDMQTHFESFPYKKSFAEDLFVSQFGISIDNLFGWNAENENFSSSGYELRSAYNKNQLWVALKETVCYYDSSKKEFVKLPKMIVEGNRNDGPIPIKGITFYKNQPLVIHSNSNIFLYNPELKKWDFFLAPYTIKKKFGHQIFPQDIYADNDKIWITTSEHGLIYVDITTKKLHQIKQHSSSNSLPTNHLIGFSYNPERPDLLWIGSYEGLLCFNKKTMQFKVFSTAEGLPDNNVYSILEDQLGYLWLSTNKGLCRFNPVNYKVRTFKTANGLQGNEFNRFHYFKLPDGKLAFGGVNGWNLFDPLSIKPDRFATPIALTGLKINNLAVDDKNPLLPQPLNILTELKLSYNNNTISLSFAGLEFNQPQDLLYRYQLEGYDKTWILSGNNNEAVYTKISPGSYLFKVNASNSTGKWSDKIKTITIIIQPPWWQTWWALTLYMIAVILAITMYIRYRIRQEIIKQQIKLKEAETEQLRELDEIKSRFFSNITHEFRTPLTLITGPAQQLQDFPNNDQQQRLLTTIIKNAQQLLGLTNQLMDLAKLEARAMKPNLVKGDIVEFIKSLIEAFQNEALQKNITIVFHKPDQDCNYWFSAEMLERIIYNLLSNALKFTNPFGTIDITFTETNSGVQITVKDTGIGIDEEKLPFVFNRFYQAGNIHDFTSYNHSSGTGIGLALVKELIDLQEGTITAENYTDPSTKTSGTLFTLQLPYEKIHSSITGSLPVVLAVNEENNDESLPLILIVEDNPELAEFIIGSLNVKYRVIYAEDGKKGLGLAFETIPDLIISDVLMPVMDGFTLCTQLKSDIRTSHIPVILLTAKADFDSKIQGLSKGADDYITKPFHVPELLLRVNNHLEQVQRMRTFIQNDFRLLPNVFRQGNDNEIKNEFLETLYNITEDNLDNPLFGVEELVAALNISRTSLHRKVKALSGLSTTEIIRAYRLKRAATFLTKGSNSAEAAYKTGFSSPAYFSKSFRELFNITPTDFIKQSKS